MDYFGSNGVPKKEELGVLLSNVVEVIRSE